VALADALAALEAGDRVRCLDELVAAWRETRAPAIADAIDAVSVDVARGVPPLPAGRTLAEAHERWIEVCRAGRAVDVPRLLESIAYGAIYNSELRERLEHLERYLAPDPRIANKLVEFVIRTPERSRHAMWTVAFRMLVAHRDARGRAAIDELPAISPHQTVFAKRVAKLRRTLLTEPAAADLALVSRVVELAEARRLEPAQPVAEAAPRPIATPQREEDLLAQVYAAPDDPGPRIVYGDWCTERELPRGELIALQLKPRPSSDEQSRARALLRAHLSDWLGPLERVVAADTARFERGFLAACRTRFRTQAQRDELGGHPMWSTLVEVITDEPAVARARGLRALRGAKRRLLAGLEAGPPIAVDTLGVVVDTGGAYLAQIPSARTFPRVATLELSVEYDTQVVYPEEIALRALPTVRRVVFERYPRWAPIALAFWLPALPAHVAELAVLDVGGFTLDIARRDDGTFAIRADLFGCGLVRDHVVASFAGLDPARVTLALERAGSAERSAIDRAMRRG
jgi:uncharacterized protein (TIGR02996 family)